MDNKLRRVLLISDNQSISRRLLGLDYSGSELRILALDDPFTGRFLTPAPTGRLTAMSLQGSSTMYVGARKVRTRSFRNTERRRAFETEAFERVQDLAAWGGHFTTREKKRVKRWANQTIKDIMAARKKAAQDGRASELPTDGRQTLRNFRNSLARGLKGKLK